MPNDRPTFQYQIYGATGIGCRTGTGKRTRSYVGNLPCRTRSGELYARLAEGATIEDAGKGMYLVDGKSYYLRLDDASGAKPVVRDANGRKELVVPVRSKLSYSILF